MNRENQQLTTNEFFEFKKLLVEIEDFRKIIDHFIGIYGTTTTFTKLDLDTLGLWLIMPIYSSWLLNRINRLRVTKMVDMNT